jgi:eukaryotic-like serine/threonine-protein kinase
VSESTADDRPEVAGGLRVGDVLAGKYRIDRVLGEGGMGVVAAAWHVQLEERVAIKFLLPEALGNEETLSRFTREARAAVRIKSEHVARVIDVGTLETGAPYMVMEYLQGEDLSDRVRRVGPLPVKKSVEYILQACEAIAEAHTLGIIHRDLKPANLYVITRPDGTESVKVLDFGISKTTGTAAEFDMTRTHRMMGSPFYMSPEQMASSRDVDARTDVWAIAVTLYELVAGTTPFRAESLPELCIQVTQEPPSKLRELRPDAPEGLEVVIEKCLEKRREARYANLGEFVVDLAQFGPSRAHGSVERILRMLKAADGGPEDPDQMPESLVPAPVGAPAGVSSHTQANWQTTNAGAKSKRSLVLAGVGALVVLGGVAAGAWALGRGPAPAASAAVAVSAEVVAKPEPSAVPAPEPSPSALVVAPAVTSSAPGPSSPPPTVAVAPATAPRPLVPATAAPPAAATQKPAVKPASGAADPYDNRK